jgi:hypothetical protein
VPQRDSSSIGEVNAMCRDGKYALVVEHDLPDRFGAVSFVRSVFGEGAAVERHDSALSYN